MRPDADSAWLWVGPACNCRCTICPVDAATAPPGLVAGQIPRALQRRSEARREGDAGQLAVLVGGEPFVRHDVFGLLRRIREAGLLPGLVTNGRALCYPEARRRLGNAGLAYLRVQLFGWEESHDQVTRVPGSFRQTLDGLRALEDEGAAADASLDVSLALSPDTLADAPAMVDHLAALLSTPDHHLLLSVAGLGSGADHVVTLQRAVDALARWNHQSFRPLLVWEGLPDCLVTAPSHVARPPSRRTWSGVRSAPSATCLGDRGRPPSYPTDHCDACPARRRCRGVPFEGFVPRAADVPARSVIANSFNFVRQDVTLPLAPTPAACTADRAPGVDPARALFLAGDGELTLYRTDTGDFSLSEVSRVKHDFGHLYLDRSATAALDDFVDSIRRVAPDPYCDPCDRKERCGRRFREVDEPPFRREERWIAGWVHRLRGRILDVGCGEQLYRAQLAPLVQAGLVEYHGLDPDEAAVSELRRAIPQGRYHVGEIERFEHAAGYFDHVLCLRALNHVTDVREALSRMVALTRPLGTLLIAECVPFALLRNSGQVDFADRQPRAGHQHLRNWDSWEVAPFLRLHSLRTIYHRPVSALTNNQWVLHLLREGAPRRHVPQRETAT
ncbi:MAG: methyltransferase domain-containing protein [Deltaproteobacteria bacterium]|nr:methyltransferase domain-containing protein [Deltaproteobacteria bacterium]